MNKQKEIAESVTLEGLIEAVRSIVEAVIFEQTEREYYHVAVITTNRFTTSVEFLGNRIWCNEDEGDRMFKYGDIGNVVGREPIEDFLRRVSMEEIKKLNRISLQCPW